MSALKIGDYVWVESDLTGDEGIGQITQLHFHPKYHLVWLLDGSMPMAVLRHKDYMTKIDPVFVKLLTSVNKEES